MEDARVDEYVERAAEFARPILLHLRLLVHQACPEIDETIKWSRPFFVHRGTIIANMAAFKRHCSFGLWGPGMTPLSTDGAGGSLARIESLAGLPEDAAIVAMVRDAIKRVGNTGAAATKGRVKAVSEDIAVPQDLALALAEIDGAIAHFEALSPSCKREYVLWIEEAKRKETRARRVGETARWIAEGKRRNWKYEAAEPVV